MAGNIKGITIEFRGDTTKLDKALRQINNETRNLDKELKQVDKALKFNPTSVELWRQKQQLLTQKVEETKTKLDALKQAQAQMDAAGVDKTSEEYRRLQREIIVTENQVKTFEGQLRKVGNVNLRAMSEQFKEMGNSLTSAGQAMQGLSTAAAAVVASIGAVTVKSAAWADDINTLSKVYSISTQELQKYSAAADLVDVSVETIASSHVKLEKQMMSASKGTGASAEAFQKLGVNITNADGSLREGDAVWQDVIAALGSMTNETERDALAMQLMGRSAAELNPLIENNGETYKRVSETLAQYGLDYIDQETLDKANQFNDSLDMMKAIGMVAFQTVGTQLAAYLAPVLEKVVDLVGRLAEWFTSLSPETQTLIASIAGVVAILSPLLIGLGKISFAISSIMSLMSTLGPAIGALGSGALLPIIAIIAGVVAIGVALYKNWDLIKAKAQELWTKLTETWNSIKTTIQQTIASIISNAVGKFNELKTRVTTIWNNIKTAIITPIQNALDKVKEIVGKIKDAINNAKLKFPKLKLPHLKVSGKLSLDPPSVPKFSISWYKTGGIFDAPSVIGVGEAGPEAVVPLDKFWDKLDQMQTGGDTITINVYPSAGMNETELARKVEQALARVQKRRDMANGYI